MNKNKGLNNASDTKPKLSKTYDPHEVEDRLYEYWMRGGYFHAKINKSKKPYTVVIPPPNITGQLHMGHALDETLQDILIRFKRMKGYVTLWVPGTDHASIATEAKIVQAMREEGTSKEKIGRAEFTKRAWEWKEKFDGRIEDQIKKLGASCDWERKRFTLDDTCTKAVREVFVNLYNKGMIYKGERLINWCPMCKTSISDAEVDFSESDGFLWHLKYSLADGSGSVELATTRPETLLGDTAVAVNPNDERYKHLIGKTVIVPLVDREVPIISDDYVDVDFGTGVVKITPAHDPNDFEVGRRHNLPVIDVMTETAQMNTNAGKYEGLDRYDARREILRDLESRGVLVATEKITHNIGHCYRCNTVIEPRLSEQWFMKMSELAQGAIKCVRDEEKVKFIPQRFEKVYFNWLENIRDWCISRQLWWGHRIPVWYCDDCGDVIASKDDVVVCPKCSSAKLHQDEDTLDTWFSSALWPFSVFGWPDCTEDFEYFYPTSTLVTGYDILFFWVIRMIFSGIEHTGKVPFDNVFLHGMMRDEQGRKMSKSLGNGVDPLEVIDQYGADALRFTLATGNSPGNDMRFSMKKVESSRNFANKIWNAARFIMMNLDDDVEEITLPNTLDIEDKWIVSSLNTLCREVTNNIEKFELGVAAQKLYDFIWDEFCDWYIEIAKMKFCAKGTESANAKKVLVYVMLNTMKLLHPFMPFLTEEIFLTMMPHGGGSISVEQYPEFSRELDFPDAAESMRSIMNAIKAIRNRRAEMNIPPSKKARVFIDTSKESIFVQGLKFIQKLAYADEVLIGKKCDEDGLIAIVTSDARIYIPLSELIDRDAEIERLTRELENAEKMLSQCKSKLSNQAFLEKAPEKVIAGVKGSYDSLTEKIELLRASIAQASS